nr:hypothetical protein [Caldilineaceae bacterium]
HRTNKDAREDHHNNSGALPEQNDVVVALTDFGLAPQIAQRLANRYSRERIEEKLAYIAFLQQQQPERVENPRGWLRRAIEEDYGPPDGFMTAAERARQEAEVAEQAQRLAAGEEQQQALAAQHQAQKEERKRRLQEAYGTSEADYRLWAEVLESFRQTRPELYDLYGQGQILNCTEGVVRLGFENEGALHRLDHPGTLAALKRQFKLVAQRALEVERILLPVVGQGQEEGAARAPARVKDRSGQRGSGRARIRRAAGDPLQ